MRDSMLAPFCRAEFVAAELMESFPPVWRNGNKQVVASISCPTGCEHHGTIGFTSWKTRPLADELPVNPAETLIEPRSGFFEYQPTSEPETTVAWYLNFADPQLFGFYGGSLLAQDEMQVAEHPALAALVQALEHERIAPRTVDARGNATPVLVTGVERRCAISTEPNVALKRPQGLYGNRFAAAAPDVVRAATVAIDPPTISNILAMAAPGYGSGEYTQKSIEEILRMTVTGYSAACIESERLQPQVTKVEIHTGHWGCGAFGGNRELMATLQILAAQLSGVAKLVYCYGDAAGREPVVAAERLLADILSRSSTLGDVVTAITAKRFKWGVSDGN